MKNQSPICTNSDDAVSFWRTYFAAIGFGLNIDSVAVITMDSERRMTGAHTVESKAFGNAARFVDELFSATFLDGADKILIIHNRPGVPATAGSEDFERVREIILAARAKKCELLDYLILGVPTDECLAGVFSFHHQRGFSSENPFSKQKVKR